MPRHPGVEVGADPEDVAKTLNTVIVPADALPTPPVLAPKTDHGPPREEAETVFLMPHEAYSYISSRLIKEVAGHGGSVKGLVPAGVDIFDVSSIPNQMIRSEK